VTVAAGREAPANAGVPALPRVEHGASTVDLASTTTQPATGEDGRSAPDDEHRPAERPAEAIQEPAKITRLGVMTRTLLEEVRSAPLDEASRGRLGEIHRICVEELGSGLSPDLREELERLRTVFDPGSTPTDAELRIAHAQLVGWLEGLFHGIQAAVAAQQMAARTQLQKLRSGRSGGNGNGETRREPGGDLYL